MFCGAGYPACPAGAGVQLCPGTGMTWSVYNDVSGVEGVQSCLMFVTNTSLTGVDWRTASGLCPALAPGAKLLTSRGYLNDDSLLTAANTLARRASWVGAVRASGGPGWAWSDNLKAPADNLNGALNVWSAGAVPEYVHGGWDTT